MTPPNGTLALPPAEIVSCWRSRSQPTAPMPTDLSPRLPRMQGIKGVIFDVYGTLFISAAGEIGHTAADNEQRFRTVLARFNLQVAGAASSATVWRQAISRRHAASRQHGIDHPEVDIRAVWRETLARLIEAGRISGPLPDADTLERLALDYEAETNPVWPMPGARETLDALRAGGQLLGIVSNAQFFTPLLFDALMHASLPALGFAPSLCVWSYRMGEAKPSGRLFDALLRNANRFGIAQPSQLLYVGNDMRNDMLAAQQAGLRTALFAGDRRSLRLRTDDPACSAITPDAVLTRLAQIQQLSGNFTRSNPD